MAVKSVCTRPLIGTACAATDTLDRPLGDVTEAMTAAALEWLRTGACPAVRVDPAARSKPFGAPSAERFTPPRPLSPARLWLPGVS
jgi:hypothetical protein